MRLLAPAGDWECARAAVENGADAIYFGLTRFNARLRAQNFTESDLPELMRWLHTRGVRGYVTFNTLVFTEELPEAEAYLRTLIAAGVDAVIVQDVGLCRLIRRLTPDLPIHASTQMTVTSAAGVRFARELGCQLVVLARENSLKEIRMIQDALASAQGEGEADPADMSRGTPGPAVAQGLPLEVFVHGALCVAYSGQCLTSEALGGRSANRGECAQACRLPYELYSDGKKVDLGDRRYLLSPQDLAGLELVPELARAGVVSLKIEGRLKSPDYVASITRLYRAALDRLEAGAAGSGGGGASERQGYEMEMAFSRGLYTGWLGGIDNQRLVHGRFGKKRGVALGRVTRVDRETVWLRAEAPVKAGDGVVFDSGRPEEKEEGGRVFEVREARGGSGELGLLFMRDAVDFRRVRVGDRVWKTSDPELERELRQTYAGETPRHARPVVAEVHGRLGTPLTLILRDGEGNVVRVESAMPLEEATQRPMDEALLRAQVGRMGGTGLKLEGLAMALEGSVRLPVSELNRLRREAVAALLARRSEPRRWTLHAESDGRAGGSLAAALSHGTGEGGREVELVVMARNVGQLEAARRAGVRTLSLEFEDPKRYREAVADVRAMGGAEVWVAPPQVSKPGEEWILRIVESAGADGYLVRNYDHLEAFRGRRMIGDFSLNVANPLSAEYFLERYGLERVTASYDLNAEQLEALVRRVPSGRLEVTIHQHMPLFHMEHCVFCAFLSKGKDYRDCGRPCDRHDVRLKDRVGALHPVKADAGCRNTLFHARAQTGAEHLTRWVAAGARSFRIEFLDETPAQVTALIEGYRRVLRGELSGEALWREFRLTNQVGVTRGQMGRASGADLGEDRWADTRAYAAAW